MRDFVCKNCGERFTTVKEYDVERKFCSKQCYREFCKKHPIPGAGSNGYKLTKPKTPEAQCKKCEFGNCIGSTWCCGYFDIGDNHSRHYLHPEGLPDVCQEYKPKKRKRKPRPIEVY